MKKIVTGALAALFVLLPLCGCGQGKTDNSLENSYIEAPAPKPEEAEKTPEKVEEPKTEKSPEKSEEPAPKEEAPKPTVQLVKKAQYIRVLTENLNIRSGPGTGYSSLGKAQKGVLLAFSGRTGNWYETLYRGKIAYVSASECYTAVTELPSSEEKIERVISEGLKYLGTPYVYGATRYHDGYGNLLKGFTDTKFDCSSLMQYIFYKGANKLLQVTTRTQIKQGDFVADEDLKRGDLLFFTNDSRCGNTGIERVGHVALYLGENYILHTASDVAKIESISQKRWNYFLQARRVL